MTIEWLCGALLSTQFESDVAAVNPLHGDLSLLRQQLVSFMMLSNRSYFASQTIGAAQQLFRFMEMVHALWSYVYSSSSPTRNEEEKEEEATKMSFCGSSEVVRYASQLSVDHDTTLEGSAMIGGIASAMKGRFLQLAGTLGELVSVKRNYVEEIEMGESQSDTATVTSNTSARAYALDPRFLSFEFIFSIILRKRQVEMVRWFKENLDKGHSRVQQMIMGQGKTTVVGPLLALMLADGNTLVTQVMPTALLEQSRNVLRRCFSVIIPKRIYTLQFDRGVEDSESVVEILYQKLKSAKESRSIVVSAPECIKALFLKYIEQLHALESTSEEDLSSTAAAQSENQGQGSRQAKEAKLIKNKAIARSKMADAIVPILDMWREGVLIMDEVDVLLHPLRSELNFPIGTKHPIEMSGARWLLPIHILDGIFYASRGRVSGTLAAASSSVVAKGSTAGHSSSPSSPTEKPDDVEAALKKEEASVLEPLRASIAKGIESHAIQREPHVVLLDLDFYHKELKHCIAQWAILWLWRTVEKEQLRMRRQAERQAQLAEITRLQREQQFEKALDDNATTANKKPQSGFSLADHPRLNITRERFCQLAQSFLLDSRAMSSASSASSGFAALLALGAELSTHLMPSAVQLLFLARDWLDTLLPHVLSKINRVGFGILQSNDLHSLQSATGGDGKETGMPLSRRLMAVPFVAKDVPSRSSEFAHPDVVIGLTILAYRYEGMRKSDVKELLLQLKQDYSRQSGPRERRPASVLFNKWLEMARTDHQQQHRLHLQEGGTTNTAGDNNNGAAFASVPLSQLQVLDPAQLNTIHKSLRHLPEATHYYLCQHTFPRTMNFQKMKLSASGHELASNILFGKRVGFSGTPSNLLPLDMGECEYEPGSDGKILSVLTDPTVTSSEELAEGWTPLKVLRQIATSNPPFHALIDTGALITNMDNEQVARFLIEHLPLSFEGVVFLDVNDKQVVLQRNNMQIVPLSQCGVALSRRFTFFDQVHTTGMDIKQSPTAMAAVTIGKDMVFRDYAQGAFRMRGIGKGQRIKLFLIPEVVARVRESLFAIDPKAAQNTNAVNIPAWLLLNAMRVEGLQFVKLSSQELENVWRKLALRYLIEDSSCANAHPSSFTDFQRVRRFALTAPPMSNKKREEGGNDYPSNSPSSSAVPSDFLGICINAFREAIGFPVPSAVEAPTCYSEKVRQHFAEKPRELLTGPASSADDTHPHTEHKKEEDCQSVARIEFVMRRMMASLSHSAKESDEMGLNAEVVHEQEAEEEQEQEAEQEEQRISALKRDDEQQIPWDVRAIEANATGLASGVPTKVTTANAGGNDGGITSSSAAVASSSSSTYESPFYLCSSFQLRPEQPLIDIPSYLGLSDNFFRKRWSGLGDRRLRNCFVFAQWILRGTPSDTQPADRCHTTEGAIVTLAEAETLRWLLHHNRNVQSAVPLALRIVGSGRYVEASRVFREMLAESVDPRNSSLSSQPQQQEHLTGGGDRESCCSVCYAAECRAEFEASDAVLVGNSGKSQLPPLIIPAAAAASSSPNDDRSVMNAAHMLTDPIALWYRFFNNDMFYTPHELRVLASRVLNKVSFSSRVAFFMECLRLRRRHRNDFEDAPIADLFTVEEDRDELKDIAALKTLELTLVRFAKNKDEDYIKSCVSKSPDVHGSSLQGGRGKSAHIDPNFMTEEEQLQMILARTAAAHNDGSSASSASLPLSGTATNLFTASFRTTLKKLMEAHTSSASEASAQSSSKQVATILRDALLSAVKETAKERKRQEQRQAEKEKANGLAASVKTEEDMTANIRLPASLASLDLEAAMVRVEAVLLEKAIEEARKADHSAAVNSTKGGTAESKNGITYESLVRVVPVLNLEYESIEEAKIVAAKAARKAARQRNNKQRKSKNSAAITTAAASAASPTASGAGAEWSCPACTFHNESRAAFCVVCYTDKPPQGETSASASGAVVEVEENNGSDNPNTHSDTITSSAVVPEQDDTNDVCVSDSEDEDDDDDESSPQQFEWNCPACTFFNEPSARECVICNTPNPTPPPAPKKTSSANNTSNGTNKASATSADGAGAWGAGGGREIPDGMWACSPEHGGCSLFNSKDSYYCKACDKARPDLATMRF